MLRALLIAACLAARGVDGATWEYVIFGRPWGFSLEDIMVPVRLWHGEKDEMCPVDMGRRLAASIPGCRATFYPDDGHLSIMRHYGECLDAVSV